MQHTPAKSTKFDDLDSLEDLATRLANKHSHIGVVHTVISAWALGQRPHHAIPVVASASCKYSNPQQQRMVFETVSELFLVEVHGHVAFMCPACHVDKNLNTSRPNFPSANGSRQLDHVSFSHSLLLLFVFPPCMSPQILSIWHDRFANTIGPIVLVASDGDGVRCRLLHDFTSMVTAPMFADLALVDDTTSSGGVVQCFDLKHNLKRLRTRDISKNGVNISTNARALNCDSFPELVAWYDGKPKETCRTLVNPKDRCVHSRRVEQVIDSALSSCVGCAREV